jgi:hypothetical protein
MLYLDNAPSMGSPNYSPAAFDFGAVFGGVALGRDLSGSFAFSLYGLAVGRPDGTWVTLADGEDTLLDVTPLVLAGVDPWVFRLPVAPNTLRRGDLILAADTPFSPLFLLGTPPPNQPILALDPIARQVVQFATPRNLFVDFEFVVQAVSVLDIFG